MMSLLKYKCPFNYVGSKSQLLPVLIDIISLHEDKIFVDLFAGGFSVGANVKNSKVLYNDINNDLMHLIKLIYESSFEEFENKLCQLINAYELSKTNTDAYYRLRVDFNNTKDSYLFALLIFYSFNHQIRYNQAGGFNTPFGKNRSSYNPNSRKKLKVFYDLIRQKEIDFFSSNYEDIEIHSEMIVYVDPPYFVTTGSYNDGNRGITSWNEEDEKSLYEYLDNLNLNNIPFILSNMLSKGDNFNHILDNWSKKYNILDVKTSYKNYHRKNTESKEIIVKNF